MIKSWSPSFSISPAVIPCALSNMPNSHIFLEKITEVHNYEECLHKILYETKNNLKENEQTNNFPYEIVNNCLIPYIATVNRRKHRFN